MLSDIPTPLTSVDMDVRDLDGFMLNVERLLASELWALTKNQPLAFRGAVGLWARAWKQIPPASLPNDEAVIAAFADMPLSKFRKCRALVMRGFELCSDGRFYHRKLSEEVNKIWPSVAKKRRDREADNLRLKQWRDKRRNGTETASETHGETRFETEVKPVPNGVDTDTDTDRDNTSKKKEVGADAPAIPGISLIPDWVPKDAWAGFVEMRKKIRAPLTGRAIKITIIKLADLHAAGEDPGAVLDQSTANSWKGVFPVKHDNGGRNGNGRPSAHANHTAGAALFIASLSGDDERRGQGQVSNDVDGPVVPLLAP